MWGQEAPTGENRYGNARDSGTRGGFSRFLRVVCVRVVFSDRVGVLGFVKSFSSKKRRLVIFKVFMYD